MRVLVLGATGMLGNAVVRLFSESSGYETFGTTRSRTLHYRLADDLQRRLLDQVDVENTDVLIKLFGDIKPDVVVNCVGLVKQVSGANDPLAALPVNAILPHRLVRLCQAVEARLVHISTDCVFDGASGRYTENDRPNAYDLYGRSKLLGEVDAEGAVTLRTSIIGRELGSAHGLIDWFLTRDGNVKGYTQAIFSGLPTVELARVIRDFVLPRPELRGIYHVSAAPISKYDLLRLVADIYNHDIELCPDDKIKIDRSLDSRRFQAETGYQPPTWPELVRLMRDFG